MPDQILTTQLCTRDLRFQNWTHETGILTRERPAEAVSTAAHTYAPDTIPGRIDTVLTSYAGYIVSRPQLADDLFGGHGSKEMSKVNNGIQKLQQNPRDGKALFVAYNLGVAHDISDLRVAGEGLLIVYRLWQNLHNEVSEPELAQALHGRADFSVIRSVRKQAAKVRCHELTRTDAVMYQNQTKDTDHVHMLTTHAEISRRAQEATPPYLGKRFQRWLQRPDIGLVTLLPPSSTEVKPATHPAYKYYQLQELLEENWGYVVPLEVISVYLYGSVHYAENTRAYVAYAANTDMIDTDVLTLDVGAGYGIASFGLSIEELKILYQFWTAARQKKPLTISDIALGYFGEDTPVTRAATQPHVDRIGRLLAKSACRVVRSDMNNEIAFMLKHKQQSDI